MTTYDRACNMATKACKLASEAKRLVKSSGKYVIIGGIDNLWHHPNRDTVIFYVVVKDNSKSPIHMEGLSYNDMINNYEGIGDCWFSSNQARKLAHKYNKMPSNHALVMSLSVFEHDYKNMVEDCEL